MLILDRIEGGMAVLETGGGMVSLPAGELPPGAKEGDVLALRVDPESTQKRRQAADLALDDLFG